MDEARFGTHSKLGHGWFQKGVRTTIPVRLGFQNFYVYGAANPQSGESFHLLLPRVCTKGMDIFLDHLSRLKPDKQLVVVMDGAGWHVSRRLIVPENIRIVYLPPYCPELNPVERLWQHIKKRTIRNRVYHGLSGLERDVCQTIKTLNANFVASICAVNWLN